MNKNKTAPPSQLSEKEKHIMSLMFEEYYHEMLNKTKKYIQDHEMAHDIVISSFENVARRYSVIKIESIKNFLYVSILHKAVKERISKKRIVLLGEVDALECQCDYSNLSQHTFCNAEHQLQYKELETAVGNCITRMTLNQSQLFDLILDKDKSYKEVAKITGKTIDQIKASWWGIKKKILDAILK